MAIHAFDRRAAGESGPSRPGSLGPILFIGLMCALLAFLAVGRTAVRTAGGPMAETPLAWQETLPTRAEAGEKPIFLYFTASWCGPCKIMKAEVLPTQRVVDAAQGYVPVMIDVDDDPITAGQFRVGSIPTIVILDADGTERERLIGLQKVDELADTLRAHR